MEYKKDKRTMNLTLRDIHVGDWVSLEDSGISFDRYNEGKNVLYIGW